MRTSVRVLVLTAGLMPTAAPAQVPRDAPPPSIQNARRERELRALVASGGATRDTYIELTTLEITQNRLDDAVAALHAAAQLEPTVPEAQHMLATIAWEHANRDVTDPAGRLSFIREGVALEDRALTLKPDYADAMTYKNILLRMQANLTNDPAEKRATHRRRRRVAQSRPGDAGSAGAAAHSQRAGVILRLPRTLRRDLCPPHAHARRREPSSAKQDA